MEYSSSVATHRNPTNRDLIGAREAYLTLRIERRWRTMASRLLAQDHDLEKIPLMLVHADLDHVDPYLQVSKDTLRQAFAGVL